VAACWCSQHGGPTACQRGARGGSPSLGRASPGTAASLPPSVWLAAPALPFARESAAQPARARSLGARPQAPALLLIVTLPVPRPMSWSVSENSQRSRPCAKPRRRRFGVIIAQPARPRSNPCVCRSSIVVRRLAMVVRRCSHRPRVLFSAVRVLFNIFVMVTHTN
jgi:hypothetical protein